MLNCCKINGKPYQIWIDNIFPHIKTKFHTSDYYFSNIFQRLEKANYSPLKNRQKALIFSDVSSRI